jgi:cyanate permease
MSIIPVLFLAALVLGILGMVYMPQHIDVFTILFGIGACGIMLILFYLSILAIGSCARPEPKRSVSVRTKL